MPIVTLLQLQERHRDRVNVHLDGEFAFALAFDVAVGLRKGQDLTPDEIARLAGEDAYRVGLDQALRFLAHRPRSRQEVTRHLTGHDVPPPALDRILERLVALGLVDDAAFARWWVDNRTAHQPRGSLALRHELAAHGVERTEIDAAMAGLDESGLARLVAQSHLARVADRDRATFDRKLGGILLRRGFDREVVRSALDQAWSEARSAAAAD